MRPLDPDLRAHARDMSVSVVRYDDHGALTCVEQLPLRSAMTPGGYVYVLTHDLISLGSSLQSNLHIHSKYVFRRTLSAKELIHKLKFEPPNALTLRQP